MSSRKAALVLSIALAIWGATNACGSGADDSSGDDTLADGGADGASDAAMPDGTTATGPIATQLENAGFTVHPGTYGFFDASQCCSLPSCFGNNPSSPYASVSLTLPDGGTNNYWQLRQDEAVAVVATTPPSGKYFGYTPYVFDQENKAGTGRDVVFASIGDTLNDLVIQASATPPFSASVAFVMTANQTTYANVSKALVASGVASATINAMPIPTTPDVAIGLGPNDATFAILQRMALLDDHDAGAAYQATPPVQVFDALPQNEIAATPYPAPTFRTPGTGTNESSLQASMTALHDAIVAKFSSATQIPLNIAVKAPLENNQYGYYCIDNATTCNGDNRDAVYGSSDIFLMGTTDSVIVYGVNHAASGKATYSNFAIYDLGKLLGVAAVDDTQYGASAAVFVPADPNVSKLYAWTFARDCTGNDFCTVIPTTCPGIGDLGSAIIATRAYLEPGTKTRPLDTELVLDQAIHIKP